MSETPSAFASFTAQRKTTIIGLAAVIVACFMPYMKMEDAYEEASESISLKRFFGDEMIDAPHWIYLVIAVAAAGVYCAYTKIDDAALLLAGLAGGAGVILTGAFLDLIKTALIATDAEGGVSADLGAFVMVLGAAAACWGAFKTERASKEPPA